MISLIKGQQFSTDIKRLLREPIMIILFLAPLLALLVIKLLLVFGVPFLKLQTGFNLSPWYGYVLTAVILLAPGMLGAVSGFMMIDDRDERMTDLMSVTPLGFDGYLINRLVMPFLMSGLYTFFGYYLLNIYRIHILKLVLICILTGVQSVTVGLCLFLFTDNKVKGLTYAKGMSGLMVTCLADLAGIPWLTVLCSFLPFYWITRIVIGPLTFMTVILSVIVHALWLGIALLKVYKS